MELRRLLADGEGVSDFEQEENINSCETVVLPITTHNSTSHAALMGWVEMQASV